MISLNYKIKNQDKIVRGVQGLITKNEKLGYPQIETPTTRKVVSSCLVQRNIRNKHQKEIRKP